MLELFEPPVNPIILSLLSGLIGALLVFILDEVISSRRESAYRRSLTALLDEELTVIAHQLKGVGKSTALITTVWDEKKVDFARFVTPEVTRELCRLYFWYRKINDAPLEFATMDLTELRLNTSKTQERLKRWQ